MYINLIIIDISQETYRSWRFHSVRLEGGGGLLIVLVELLALSLADLAQLQQARDRQPLPSHAPEI